MTAAVFVLLWLLTATAVALLIGRTIHLRDTTAAPPPGADLTAPGRGARRHLTPVP